MLNILKNNQGNILTEYSLFMAIISIPCFCLLTVCGTNMNLQIHKSVVESNSYNLNPSDYECSLGFTKSC